MKDIMFVIPFAGGSSSSYSKWNERDEYEFVYLDLPGKGKRRKQIFLTSFSAMVLDCVKQIQQYIQMGNVRKYYIWGHSMGSYLAYETTKILFENGNLLPEYLIMSATIAPHFINLQKIKQLLLDEKEFSDYLVEFGVIGRKVAESKYFKKNYFPMIRNDYEAMLSYKCDKNYSIKQKVLVINGKRDDILPEQVIRWGELFTEVPSYLWIDGGHFFIFENTNRLFAEVRQLIKYEEDNIRDSE